MIEEWDNIYWSPATGCLHGCWYCFWRETSIYFPCSYPGGFEPTFHPETLGEPLWLKTPTDIKVCRDADLFGAWVPDEWIERVFETVKSCPWHTFQFLTKNPARYRTLDLPENGIYGATVDTVAALHRLEDLRNLDRSTFVHFQPLLEELDPDLTGIDAIFIGAVGTPLGSIWLPPEPTWVQRIIDRATEAGAFVELSSVVQNQLLGYRQGIAVTYL